MLENYTVPGWQCVRNIGGGSYGTVFEIQKTEADKTFNAALKVISIPRDDSEIAAAQSDGLDIYAYFGNMVKNVTNEIALMSELAGFTNIVSYQDHMVVEHRNSFGWDILIRMELLTSLTAYTAGRTLSEQEIIRLGVDICKALELCWEKKILHRDIKPENIFINRHGDFKLGDFGVARTIENDRTTGTLAGTETYMAPEVYRGEAYGHTADLYSLAMVLYKFLNNNRTPFLPQGNFVAGDKEKAKNLRMSGKQIPPPVNGSEQLKKTLLKALSFQPGKRFRSAAEFGEALKNCLSDPAPKKEFSESNGPFAKKLLKKEPPKSSVFPKKSPGDAGDERTVRAVEATETPEPPKNERQKSIVPSEKTPGNADDEWTMRAVEVTEKPGAAKKPSFKAVIMLVSIGLAAIVGTVFLISHFYDTKSGRHLTSTDPAGQTSTAAVEESETGRIQADASEVEVGKTVELSLIVGKKQYIYRKEEGLTWASSDPSVAAVDDSGVVTGIKPGTVVITASFRGIVAQWQIIVTAA